MITSILSNLISRLSQLPYLDAKHEYLWSHFSINDVVCPLLSHTDELWPIGIQTDRDAAVIRIDARNTVESLRDQLQALLNTGYDDGGFPILRPSGDNRKMRMVGYIGASELEHALGWSSHL